MGYDAFVRCNCLKEGKTTSPPVPTASIYIDSDGCYDFKTGSEIALEEPSGINHDTAIAFQSWLQTCCKHRDMEYCSEWVSNSGGLGFLIYNVKLASREIAGGPSSYLYRLLSERNSFDYNEHNVKQALNELDRYRCWIFSQEETVLIDESTGDEIYRPLSSDARPIFFNGDMQVSLEPKGIEAYSLENYIPVFCSNRFSISIKEKEVCGTTLLFQSFTDTEMLLMPNASELTPIGITNGEPYRVFRVETKPVDLDEYIPVTKRLKNLLKSSLETGNPVVWC